MAPNMPICLLAPVMLLSIRTITRSHMLQAYGQTTYLVTTLKRVSRGTEGAISMEGTLAGAGAALGFAALAATIGQVQFCLAATSVMQAASSVLQRRLTLNITPFHDAAVCQVSDLCNSHSPCEILTAKACSDLIKW